MLGKHFDSAILVIYEGSFTIYGQALPPGFLIRTYYQSMEHVNASEGAKAIVLHKKKNPELWKLQHKDFLDLSDFIHEIALLGDFTY